MPLPPPLSPNIRTSQFVSSFFWLETPPPSIL
jgi:hypothetical protein